MTACHFLQLGGLALLILLIGQETTAFHHVSHHHQHLRISTRSRTIGSDFGQKEQKSIGKYHFHGSIQTVSTTLMLARRQSNSDRKSQRRRRRQLNKDVVIIGGGLAGLSVALYLTQIDPDRHVTILEKNDSLAAPTGSFAAAGMLAPQSERLPKGHLLDICLQSKKLFPEFVELVECMAQDAGDEGQIYFQHYKNQKSENDLEPWNIGYVATGGFLAPAFAGDNVATWAPPEDSKGNAKWLDYTQVRELEPSLHPDVVGGWWFPEDSSVDARRLTQSLKAAIVGAGVQILSGPNYEVSSLDLEEGTCHGLWLKNGKYIAAKDVLVANGSWMRQLLPVPIEPHKGQSLSLRMPSDRPPILRRVLFAQDSYIVPKADGRIVIGATVEAGSYDPHVTPAGIMHILSYALQLVPELADLPLEETWAGLRPTTPDKGPILGKTPWNNLFLAGGYWRNGVLLAPKTGELIASLIAGEELEEEDQALLDAFAWDRFTSEEGGAAIAAASRYAASMYPIHRRKSGAGVSASVGTELGSYSTANSARDERRKDRESLWDFGGNNDDAFELAANMGKQDGTAFTLDGISKSKRQPPVETKEATVETPKSAVDDDTTATSGTASLGNVYDQIRQNKAAAQSQNDLPTEAPEERPDPGFRVYHVDESTGEHHEVPPYTAPGDFLASIYGKSILSPPTPLGNEPKQSQKDDAGSADETPATMHDGYSDIKQSARESSDVREAMRQARLQNRRDNDDSNSDSELELYASSALKPEDTADKTIASSSSSSPLSNVYDQIRQNKASVETDLAPESPDERPDPGFRVYHLDESTGKHYEVPPYTSPGEFMASIQKNKEGSEGSGPANEELVVKNSSGEIMSGNHVLDTVQPNGAQASTHFPGTATHHTAAEKNGEKNDYSEKTYDGYQAIIQGAPIDRNQQLEVMREARRRNRVGQDGVDENELHL